MSHRKEAKKSPAIDLSEHSAQGVSQSTTTFQANREKSIETSSSPKYVNKKAVVVGAGPGGITAAAQLAKNGFTVEVYEARPDMKLHAADSRRAIGIILQPSSAAVLKDIGLDLPLIEEGYVNGFHTFKGVKTIVSAGRVEDFPTESQGCITGNRHDITCTLLDFVRTNYSSSVAFHFDHLCTKISFDEKTVTFRTADHREYSVDYDLLVAADGANSCIRKQQEEIDKKFKTRLYSSRVSYKGISPLSALPKENVYMNALLPGNFVSYFNRQGSIKSKRFSGSMLYRMAADGAVHAVISASTHVFEEIEGKEEEWLLSFLPNDFPDVWKREICQKFRNTEASRTPSLLRLSKFIGLRTVFIGDAAHSVPPNIGLGMNLAIQDGRALKDALQQGNGDIDAALQRFNALRYDDVQLIQSIEQNFMGSKLQLPLILAIKQRFFGWHFLFYTLGHRFLPRWIPKHPVYQIHPEKTSAKKVMSLVRRDYSILSALFLCVILFFRR